jgi:hypothetical protein
VQSKDLLFARGAGTFRNAHPKLAEIHFASMTIAWFALGAPANLFCRDKSFDFRTYCKTKVKRSPTKSHYLVVANAVFAELYERRGHWPDRESGQ